MTLEIIEILVAALVAMAGIITTSLIGYIKNKAAQDLAKRVQDLAMVVVQDTWETFVEEVKTQEGGLTPEAAKVARDRALESLKSYIGPRGIKAIMYLIGQGDLQGKTLDEYLTSEIHAALVEAKNVGRASK